MNDVNIHHRNIQTLMIELFIKYVLASAIIASVLNRRTICYNFKNLQEFQSERKPTCVLWFRNNKLPRTPIMYNFCWKSLNKGTQ